MIHIFSDLEGLSRAAADLFIQQARESVNARGCFNVALSGGRTPLRTYQLLAQPTRRDKTPWSHIRVFWGDERCVAPDDNHNNALMAHRAMLSHVPARSGRVHPIRCDAAPEAGAAAYNELLHQHLAAAGSVLDLVLLGLGRDGHTASLFPGSPVLEEKTRWAAEVYAADQGIHRVTMTPEIINAARVVTFLVSGSEKARILKTVLEDRTDTRRLPAQRIRPRDGRLIWMVDRAAASLLAECPSKQRPT